MKPAIWRIFQNGRWSYADQPSTRHQDRPAWQPLYASADTDAGREVLVAWMTRQGYSTGHGDTIEDLLAELDWQIAEKIAIEREACAKVAESYEPRCDSCPSGVANAIRARGQ